MSATTPTPAEPTDQERFEAATRIVAESFLTDDLRLIIHTVASGLGADWDVHIALRMIAAAERIEWVNSILRHDLAVTCNGRTVMFGVRRRR